MIELVELSSDREEEYRHFLLLNPRTLIYATLEFRNFLSSTAAGSPTYLLALCSGEIRGVLPFFTLKHPAYGKIINSLPWYGSYGGCTLADETNSDVRNALLARYREIISEADVLGSTLIASPFESQSEDQYSAILNPTTIDKRIGQISVLPSGEEIIDEKLMSTFRKKTRNIVRKSLGQNFRLVISDDDWAWQFLYDTHVENLQSIGGGAKPWEHFAAIRQNIPFDWRNIFVALLDDEPVAALLMLYFNQTTEYITPVIKHEYRSSQPLSFLIWHAMFHASNHGIKWWNWGGPWYSQKSLRHFKNGWGAADFPYTYFINLKPESLPFFKSDLSEIKSAFPYYYLLPFSMVK